MRTAQSNSEKTQRYNGATLPEVKPLHKHKVVFRNDWKDYIAQNEPAEAVDPVVLARASEALSILVEDEGPIDQVYSIVILSSDQLIDDGTDVDWVQT